LGSPACRAGYIRRKQARRKEAIALETNLKPDEMQGGSHKDLGVFQKAFAVQVISDTYESLIAFDLTFVLIN
jgi:hypothetical protein